MTAFSPVDADLHVLDTELRQPFSFGGVTVTEQPHLFVRLVTDVDGTRTNGLAADGLSPLWFQKETGYREGLDAMLATVRSAREAALSAGPAPTVFEWWYDAYERQRARAGEDHPPLLWGFGLSLFERAAIDACCRARETTFHEAVRDGAFGLRPGVFTDALAGREPASLLPDTPTRSMAIRHTVGLGDPLTSADLDDDRDDGLPRTLAAYVRADGLDHFKVKVGGDPVADVERLTRIARVLDAEVDGRYVVTLDANESFPDVTTLRSFRERVAATSALDRFQKSIRFVEQPLPREAALDADTTATLREWTDRPPVIIDESDDRIGRLAAALDRGYAGTSHKNVKGVFKSIANACLIEYRGRKDGRQYVLSGEDASNVGPIALEQDFAVAATLGLDHVERNGHHYFRGLSALPGELQEQVLAVHGDLYRRHPDGFPTLDVDSGRVTIGSTVDAPFGRAVDLDPGRFTPLSAWTPDTGE
jgi:hypothetical protein